MKQLLCAIPLAVLTSTHIAQADPCVGATFETPLEGAVNVKTRHADVPSPQFPGLWQEGTLNGYFYAIFANGEAVVKPARNARDWALKVTCKTGQPDCTTDKTGSPPPEAVAVATRLRQCLRADVPKPPKAPCGLQTIPAGPEGKTLQNLLVAAGQDPGPVDGILGAKTFGALVAVLGPDARALAIADAIAAMDAHLCTPPE